ncbi:unnamed protein product [Taenia asiatica]|uniref:Uncharacterized protein n=1 Tax=Taenia asiatica TaxID=60517 RepID=A0A0R3VXM7_TAEAS|nr:unnamed protein product [Taenia asiatica]
MISTKWHPLWLEAERIACQSSTCPPIGINDYKSLMSGLKPMLVHFAYTVYLLVEVGDPEVDEGTVHAEALT